ncbi:hypothetical protein [Lederbergia citri]|uniref:Uncharacterized protein n=1 Tax=Lederbergia citri TaxID=2833580 RepID=A0A942TCW2_9BACI|nr:hypothetical protein [Lederbergia citri]MBS4195355.1 hypothetical protein [Lederbergia citri]
MNLPKTIRVGAIDYSVEKIGGLSANESMWGRILYGSTVIELEGALNDTKLRDVFAHELAHALLFEAGYEDHEEEQANRVGKVLAMMLRDNDFSFMRDKEGGEWAKN